MWARVIEFMLACWLAISPFVFRHDPDQAFLWASDLVSAAVVASVALLSFRRSLRKLHLVHLVTGVWLIGVGVLGAPSPPPPALQNDVVVGLLLWMFAIVPSDSATPPPRWTDLEEPEQRAGAN